MEHYAEHACKSDTKVWRYHNWKVDLDELV